MSAGRLGYVPVVEFEGFSMDPNGMTHRMVHWTKASMINTPGKKDHVWNPRVHPKEEVLPERVLRAFEESLPSVVRRLPEQRYRAMFQRIAEDALESYRRLGYVIWPASLQRELKALGWMDGDPALARFGGVEKVYAQVEALTRSIVDKGAQIQRDKDRHKAALDHAGHYSA